MIILAIVITWVILAILFVVSDEFNIPQLAYIIAFPVYIVLFPIINRMPIYLQYLYSQ